jgi:membrane-bound serine protease (ClpP class)
MIQIYYGLLIAGVLLIGAEVFVPDGILGTMGALFLLGAAVIGFFEFPFPIAALALVGKILLVCVSIFLWIRIFPKTPFGKKMMVSENLKTAHATDESLPSLVGKKGTTTSTCCPSGFADIDGKRIDVISDGDMISAGTEVIVTKVEGYRILVEPASETTES